MGEFKITVTRGKSLDKSFSMAFDGPILIGRSHEANVRLKEDDVSGRHVRFEKSGGGVSAIILGRFGVKINEKPYEKGESVVVKVGDVFELGGKARFRIDELGLDGAGEEPAPAESDALTGETKMMTGATEFTEATRAVGETATFATVAVTNPTPTEGPKPSEETKATAFVAESDVIEAATTPFFEDDEEDAGERETETRDDPASLSLHSEEGDETGTETDGEGKTVEMKTREVSMAEINKLRDFQERRKRFRRGLLASTMILFAAFLAVIVIVRWPKKEQWLTVPTVAGSEDYDATDRSFKSALGLTRFLLVFPNDPRMTIADYDEQKGVRVMTFTGRNRDVPFKLSVDVVGGDDEWTMSLEESANRQAERLSRTEGCQCIDTRDFPSGVFFFEDEYPDSCENEQPQTGRPALSLRGTRFWRSEYVRTRRNEKGHGIVFVFRDRDAVFVIMREIPESEWTRGKYLLREDPNIALAVRFMRDHWESPGLGGMLKKPKEELYSIIETELGAPEPRVSQWLLMKRCLDTLTVLTRKSGKDEQKRVAELYARFNRVKDVKYQEFANARRLEAIQGIKGAESEAMKDCVFVFGKDETDRRCWLVNNPEVWSCK